MKKITFISTAILGLTVMLAVSGCKHTQRTTPMPVSNPPPRAEQPSQPGPDNGIRVAPETPVDTVARTPGTIPASGGGLWNRPHTEDRQKFAADTVYFDFDSSTIRKTEESKLDDVANYFKSNTTDALTVEGNCDERGTEKYNLALGDRRALAIREYLATLGVDPMRIHTVTYGAMKPVEQGHNESAWKKNRRGDLVLLQPQ